MLLHDEIKLHPITQEYEPCKKCIEESEVTYIVEEDEEDRILVVFDSNEPNEIDDYVKEPFDSDRAEETLY